MQARAHKDNKRARACALWSWRCALDLGTGEIAFDIHVLEAEERQGLFELDHIAFKLFVRAQPVARPRAGVGDDEGDALEDARPRGKLACATNAREFEGTLSQDLFRVLRAHDLLQRRARRHRILFENVRHLLKRIQLFCLRLLLAARLVALLVERPVGFGQELVQICSLGVTPHSPHTHQAARDRDTR